MDDAATRAAVWFVLDRRDNGLTLPEIVNEVLQGYRMQGLSPEPPRGYSPDTVTEWIADSWELLGLHTNRPDEEPKVIPIERRVRG